ncbi:alpha-1,2-fucosyltransferase [Amylibacter sp.]|nr:alpha-1,2-fucosyltransferase [Amylibacter sp.]
MIYSRIRGGLGNQLFQYCAARSLADSLGTSLGLDTRDFNQNSPYLLGLKNFNIRADFNPSVMIKHKNDGYIKYLIDIAFGKKQKIYKETSLNFNEKFLLLQNNSYLKGYWQTEKYFKDNKKNILNDLKIINPQSNQNKKISKKIAGTTSVSLHIRRGDYVTNTAYNAAHGTCSLTYYKNAINHLINKIGKNFTVFAFSDDPEWVSSNLKLPVSICFIDNNSSEYSYEDLRLMSECNHNIIANSSFSWWGAWLNTNHHKTVIAPNSWYADQSLKNNDIIPSNWTKI